MEFWIGVLTSPIVIIAALVIGTLGEILNRLVNAKKGDTGWRGVYYVTLPAHPVVVGVLLGFVPWLPSVEGLSKDGYDLAARVGTYALAGIVCKTGYDTLISTAKRLLQSKLASVDVGGSASKPPTPPGGYRDPPGSAGSDADPA